ncbi:MAG TPA: MFS transporter, partial [Candidatus Paceibacterota bacterium]
KTFAQKRVILYVIGFIFNLSYAIPAYINSSFLAGFVSEKLVGIIYAASSILAIAAFMEAPNVLRKFGNVKTTVGLLSLELLSLTGLIWGNGTLAIISSFMLNFVTVVLANYTLDIFLEDFSSDAKTGRIRGMFLTIVNTAWLISPYLASKILGNFGFTGLYGISAILLLPVVVLIIVKLRGIAEPRYEKLPFWKSLGEIWTDRDIKGIMIIQMLLQFFYAWMVIYTPIYLHEIIGFDWPTIGVIFTVMLLPFVILEAPLGKWADKNGEKTALSIGFVFMAIAVGLIAFMTDHSPFVWAGVLFLSRVGAATVEVMADTYFFKKVTAVKTHLISFSRMARPIAYVIGPIVATILFTVFDMRGLFIFLGFLMLYGLRYSLVIKDVK